MTVPRSAAGASGALAEVVFAALRNERAIDRRYRDLNPRIASFLRGTPDYKPMWQVGWRRRLGPLLLPALLVLAITFAFANLWGLIGLLRPGARPATGSSDDLMFATVAPNRALILAAARQSPDGPCEPVELTYRLIATALSGRERCVVATALFTLYGRILRTSGARADLALHARDALGMLALAAFAQQRPERRFWTDDHYQRWAFVLSHAPARLHVVQHGFFDTGIEFPVRFGPIDLLAVRHDRFITQFATYFDVRRWYIFVNDLSFDDLEQDHVLLLASSAPHIDEEIALLRAIRPGLGRPIAVKLHPAHRYDNRRQSLLDLADIVCAPHQRPRADIFVSHSSFMEFDYAAAGAATCSIQHVGGLDAAIRWVQAQARPTAAGR